MSDTTEQAVTEYEDAQDSTYDLASAIIDWVATPSGAQALQDAKITPDHLLTTVQPERIAREIMTWVYDYKERYEEWPIAERVYEHFRQHYTDSDGSVLSAERPGRIPVLDLAERLHTRKLRNDTMVAMEQWAVRGEDDAVASLNYCISQLTDIARDASYGIEEYVPKEYTGDQIVDAYLDRVEGGSLTRVTTGFELVDRQLGGYRGLTFIAGRPGGFKSFMTLASAHAAARKGFNVLVLTLELTAEEYRWRHVAFATKTSWNRLDNGLLSETEMEEMLIRYDFAMADLAGNITFVYPPPDQVSITALKSLAEQYDPDVVYIDQFNQIYDGKDFKTDHERAQSYLPHLKRWANELPGALIVAHQRNRVADDRKKKHNMGLDTIGRTDAIAQWADLVVTTAQLDDQKTYGAFDLLTLKARNGPQVHFSFATSMKTTCDIKCISLKED